MVSVVIIVAGCSGQNGDLGIPEQFWQSGEQSIPVVCKQHVKSNHLITRPRVKIPPSQQASPSGHIHQRSESKVIPAKSTNFSNIYSHDTVFQPCPDRFILSTPLPTRPFNLVVLLEHTSPIPILVQSCSRPPHRPWLNVLYILKLHHRVFHQRTLLPQPLIHPKCQCTSMCQGVVLCLCLLHMCVFFGI